MSHRVALVALSLALAVTAFGCASEPEPAEEPSATEPADAGDLGATTVKPIDAAYLTGTWTVTTELVEIDNEMMRPAADQPGATWTCAVEGDTMTLATDQHEYTGRIGVVAQTGWVYDASATFTDEDGYTWVSTIVVNANSPDGDLDEFEGAMSGTIDSDSEGHLYTARWTVEGKRQ